MQYYVSCHDVTGKQIGSFTVRAALMAQALEFAATNIEVILRPGQYEVRVRQFVEREAVK